MIKGARNCFVPSHTLNTGGIMTFYTGDQKSIKVIAKLLSNYANCYGQYYNTSKALIYACGLTNSRHKMLVDLLEFIMAFPHFIYLGPPYSLYI